MTHFGTPQNPDLEALSNELRAVLPAYQGMLGTNTVFGEVPSLAVAPGKSYRAKTIIPVFNGGGAVRAEIVVLAFAPGDSTGSTVTYSLDQVTIPERLRFAQRQERVIPRAKTGVEGFLPFFTATEDRIHLYLASLEVLTVDDHHTIVHGGRLGLFPANYVLSRFMQAKGEPAEPRIQLTTWKGEDGRQYGSPHAIYHHDYHHEALPPAIQVVGFLAVQDTNNPYYHLLDRLQPK